MTQVIELLEQMGQSANLQIEANVEKAIEQSTLSNELKASLLTKDTVKLDRQLDVCPDIFCVILPAEDDEGEEEDKDQKINKVINI